MTRSPKRYANREPETSLAFSISIHPWATPDLEVELGLLSDLTKSDRVLLGLAVGRLGIGQIRQGGRELVALGLDARELRLAFLEDAAQLTHLGDQLVGVPALALQLRDLIRDAVAACATLLQPREELAPALVQTQQLVERVGGPSSAKRGARRLGILADAPEVEHRRCSARPPA